jgi:hypothetical protein
MLLDQAPRFWSCHRWRLTGWQTTPRPAQAIITDVRVSRSGLHDCGAMAATVKGGTYTR